MVWENQIKPEIPLEYLAKNLWEMVWGNQYPPTLE